ncbi:AAA family ATPase [Pleionea sp. CnH1-48]|uniref:AAA family ATPase n=1 Tax=Pleionea sp. CnH1-48 TaxID=2954494 RepID=UPI002097E5B7|nr:AAA family ATPase [Pleionea sp. CnH1-48]MCO7224070.1 AAA family ATPase [Pleionea sp. CnH1-48]
MLTKLAVSNYRSLLSLKMPLTGLNVITGPNGSGKSNIYRALRLLAETARGGVIAALASEGGLDSTFWAGPETLSKAMIRGDVPVQGTPRQKSVRLKLGFASEELGYLIELGLPEPLPYPSAFERDPEIKRECIWVGDSYRRASSIVERAGPLVKAREGRSWKAVVHNIPNYDSMFDVAAGIDTTMAVFQMREMIAGWRFYDHFRTDRDAPARQPQLGTRTPVLHHDGRDLAAAIQTIKEIGDEEALDAAISDAFPGASVSILTQSDGRFTLEFSQHGLLRPLSAAELSDGTLRYLLLVAALLTPRPPTLLVLNEPENSLHPDLLPALARLIVRVSRYTQVWVVSHANRLNQALVRESDCSSIQLEKQLGQTIICGQSEFDQPAWHWS